MLKGTDWRTLAREFGGTGLYSLTVEQFISWLDLYPATIPNRTYGLVKTPHIVRGLATRNRK
jgi:hypothetical protein